MIRVVFFDLGLTLIDEQGRRFPHVEDALTTIQSFKTAQGEEVVTGLVSDFDLTTPPVTRAKIAPIFARYLARLDATGLRPFFEPVERHVTLSTHVGVRKPDRKVFEAALRRLRSKAALDECLLITESPDHVRAARTALHMSALQFATRGSPTFDFNDWLQAPAMVAHLLGEQGGSNTEAAVRHHLSHSHAFDLQELAASEHGARVSVHGTLWRPLGKSAGGDLADVLAPFVVDGVVRRGSAGELAEVELPEPAAADVKEAASLARSLASHGQIQGSTSTHVGAGTHQIETDARGRRKLVRKRFRLF